MRKSFILFSVAFGLAGFVHASSTTLFSNINQPVTDVYIDSETNLLFASAFETGSEGTVITAASFYGYNYDTTDHTVIMSIYTDAAGQVGTLVGSLNPATILARTNTVIPASGAITLSAETTYWITLQLGENISGSYLGLFATINTNTDAGSTFSVSSLGRTYSVDGSSWMDSSPGSLQYSLSGSAVPEPSLLGQCIAGGLALLFMWRRTRLVGTRRRP